MLAVLVSEASAQRSTAGVHATWFAFGMGDNSLNGASGVTAYIEHKPGFSAGALALVASYSVIPENPGETAQVLLGRVNAAIYHQGPVFQPFVGVGGGVVRFDASPNEFPECNPQTGLPENCERYVDQTAAFLSPSAGVAVVIVRQLQARLRLELFFRKESPSNGSNKQIGTSAGLEYRF